MQQSLVLVPARQYAEKIKAELRRRGVPYSHPPSIDDSGFAILVEAHDWVGSPDANFALRLCIEMLGDAGSIDIPSRRARTPAQRAKRAVAMKTIAGLWSAVIAGKGSLWASLSTAAASDKGLLSELCRLLNDLRSSADASTHDFLALVTKNLRPWGKVENLMKEVRGWIEEMRTQGQQSGRPVRIMTLQGAKGLEADIVIVTGLNDGILPRAKADAAQVEEQARLLYVSITRAKYDLHLFHARKRDASITYLPKSFDLKPSRFLAAISSDDKEQRYHPPPGERKKPR